MSDHKCERMQRSQETRFPRGLATEASSVTIAKICSDPRTGSANINFSWTGNLNKLPTHSLHFKIRDHKEWMKWRKIKRYLPANFNWIVVTFSVTVQLPTIYKKLVSDNTGYNYSLYHSILPNLHWLIFKHITNNDVNMMLTGNTFFALTSLKMFAPVFASGL